MTERDPPAFRSRSAPATVDRPRANQQQLRLQPAVVGPPVRHLPRAARRGPPGAMTIPRPTRRARSSRSGNRSWASYRHAWQRAGGSRRHRQLDEHAVLVARRLVAAQDVAAGLEIKRERALLDGLEVGDLAQAAQLALGDPALPGVKPQRLVATGACVVASVCAVSIQARLRGRRNARSGPAHASRLAR